MKGTRDQNGWRARKIRVQMKSVELDLSESLAAVCLQDAAAVGTERLVMIAVTVVTFASCFKTVCTHYLSQYGNLNFTFPWYNIYFNPAVFLTSKDRLGEIYLKTGEKVRYNRNSNMIQSMKQNEKRNTGNIISRAKLV